MKNAVLGRNSNWLIQLFRYAVVGGVAFVADFGLLWALTDLVHLQYILSGCLSFIAGLAINYTLSSLWVFGHSSGMGKGAEFMLFALIGVAGLGINALILWFMTEIIGFHYLVSKIISTLIVFVWNFTGRRTLMTSTKLNILLWKNNQTTAARQ